MKERLLFLIRNTIHLGGGVSSVDLRSPDPGLGLRRSGILLVWILGLQPNLVGLIKESWPFASDLVDYCPSFSGISRTPSFTLLTLRLTVIIPILSFGSAYLISLILLSSGLSSSQRYYLPDRRPERVLGGERSKSELVWYHLNKEYLIEFTWGHKTLFSP